MLLQSERDPVIGCSVGHIATTVGARGLLARHRKTGCSVKHIWPRATIAFLHFAMK